MLNEKLEILDNFKKRLSSLEVQAELKKKEKDRLKEKLDNIATPELLKLIENPDLEKIKKDITALIEKTEKEIEEKLSQLELILNGSN